MPGDINKTGKKKLYAKTKTESMRLLFNNIAVVESTGYFQKIPEDSREISSRE